MLDIKQIIDVMNTLSPLGALGFFGFILLSILHKKGPVKVLMNNHLYHLQQSIDKMVQLSEQNNEKLDEISSDLAYMRGKLDRY